MHDSSPRSLAIEPPPAILLVTLNARFIHASLGLRYLLANMGDLRPLTAMREFTIARPAAEIVDELLRTLHPSANGRASAGRAVTIVGFGVYIWNVRQTTEVVRLLKAAQPQITIVLGGPEISYETDTQEIVRLADHVITGWGDISFARLCRSLLHSEAPPPRIIAGEQPPLDQIIWPYAEYSDADLAHRLLYVEASRGCPFTCEFCLSALDKTAWAFDLDGFLAQMDALYRRGARHFKFVDRTFNLRTETSTRILQFFLDRLPAAQGGDDTQPIFLHFEVIPDHLPDRLKEIIARFPPGVLQLEVGIQTFDSEVQRRISRRQDNARTVANLRWLVSATNAHVHADLIFGLPGEPLESFARGFDRLYALQVNEIQLGLLKRLRGAPVARHTAAFGMAYDDEPPYTIISSAAVDAATIQRFARCARYWETIANSGRFGRTLKLLLGDAGDSTESANSPFRRFLGFSDWLWQSSGKTCGMSPESLVDRLFDYLTTIRDEPVATVRTSLLADYVASGARGAPLALRGSLPRRGAAITANAPLTRRQVRHIGRA